MASATGNFAGFNYEITDAQGNKTLARIYRRYLNNVCISLVMKRIVYRCPRFLLEEERITVRGKAATVRRIKNGAAVMVVPVLGKNCIVMERQRRPVVNDTIYEVPSGRIEKGETPLEAAKRELEEEIGYTAKRFTPIFDYYTDASLETQTTYCFVAEGLEKTKQRLDSDEVIKPIKMPVGKVTALIKQNRIKEIGSLCALLHFLYIRR